MKKDIHVPKVEDIAVAIVEEESEEEKQERMKRKEQEGDSHPRRSYGCESWTRRCVQTKRYPRV